MSITAGQTAVASDFVSTSAGAADSGKVPKLSALGQLDGTAISVFPNQDIPIATGTSVPNMGDTCFTSNTTGTVLFFCTAYSGTTLNIYRLAKDPQSGNYYITHSTTLTITANGVSGMGVVGTSLYVNAIIAGTQSVRRYVAADLTGVTSMTYTAPVYSPSNNKIMWSDNTNLYVGSGASTFDKFTISGTTLTNAATITFTSSGTSGQVQGAISDGTSVWITDGSFGSAASTIRKYVVAGGAVVTSLAPIINVAPMLNATGGTTNVESLLFIANPSTLGIGWGFNWCSATAVVGNGIHLMAITSP